MGNPNEARTDAEAGPACSAWADEAASGGVATTNPSSYPPVVPYDTGSPSRVCDGVNPPHTVEVIVTKPAERRKVLEAYILGIPLGFLGAHHFYLRRFGFGFLYMFSLGLCGVGWVTDWFRMPCLVRDANIRLQSPQQQERKSLVDAYILWFPLGLLGFHHYYLRRYRWGVLYTCTLGIVGLGWLFDIFRMPSIVKAANARKEAETAMQETLAPKPKRLCDALVLGITPLGLLGAHHFYLGRPGFGIAYMFSLGLGGVGWIVDWFRMKWLVDRANRKMVDGDYGQKHLDDAYVLCFPFGFLGLHHFYLNRPGWGMLYLCTIGCFGIGWIIDWFRLPCLVKDVNNKIEKDGQILAQQQQLGIDTSTTLLVQANGRVIRTQEGHNNPAQENPSMSSYGALESYPPSHLTSGQILQPPSYDEAVYNSPTLSPVHGYNSPTHMVQPGPAPYAPPDFASQDNSINTHIVKQTGDQSPPPSYRAEEKKK